MKGIELKEINPKAFQRLTYNFRIRNSEAKKSDLPLGNKKDLLDLDFPTHCPITGLELNYNYNIPRKHGGAMNSPSYDKINPHKGYVKGNVRVVSFLGNRMMSNVHSHKNPKEILENLLKFLTEEIKITK